MRFLATFLLKFCVNLISSEASEKKGNIAGIKIIGLWPLDPLVICHAKINSNCIHKGKEKFVWGGEKSVISVYQRLAKLLGRRPPPLPPVIYAPGYLSIT